MGGEGFREKAYGALCYSYYDKPDELPEDADEDDIDLYNEKMERYEAYEGIINAVDKWIEKVGRIGKENN